jgi:hypothetical protein
MITAMPSMALPWSGLVSQIGGLSLVVCSERA